MNAARLFVSLLALAAIAGCAGGEKSPPPLAGATIGGPFTLTDQNGRRVTDRDFAGKYRIMYFGYTSCPDVCPADMQTLGAAMRRLDRSDPALSRRIVPIFVTVDPARDTPGVLKAFVAAFYPRMIGLTGTASAIASVAHEYRVFYQAQPRDADGNYTVQHTDQAILFGPDGKPVVIVPVQETPKVVETTLEKWTS